MCVGVTLWFGLGGVVSGCRLFVELFHGLYCSGTMCVGVTLWFVWGGVVYGYNPRNNSSNKSQAPEDGCINIRNMWSSK